MESFKFSKSMRKKYLNKRFAVVETSLNADEDNNDIIDDHAQAKRKFFIINANIY